MRQNPITSSWPRILYWQDGEEMWQRDLHMGTLPTERSHGGFEVHQILLFEKSCIQGAHYSFLSFLVSAHRSNSRDLHCSASAASKRDVGLHIGHALPCSPLKAFVTVTAAALEYIRRPYSHHRNWKAGLTWYMQQFSFVEYQ